MSNVMKCFSAGILIFLLLSCTSTTSSSSTTQRTSRPFPTTINKIELAQIIDKQLIGTGKSVGTNIKLIKDGILEFSKNSVVYKGTWEFDPKEDMFPYTIAWEQDGKKQGYIANIMEVDGKIVLNGHWFITDAYITLNLELEIAK